MNQIHLEMAGLLLIPGDAPHGNLAFQPMGAPGASANQAGFILPDALEDTSHRGGAYAAQLIQQLG